MCVCVCILYHVCVFARILCKCVYVCVCILCMCLCGCTHSVYICVCVCVCVHTVSCVCVCFVFVCMCVCACVHAYAYYTLACVCVCLPMCHSPGMALACEGDGARGGIPVTPRPDSPHFLTSSSSMPLGGLSPALGQPFQSPTQGSVSLSLSLSLSHSRSLFLPLSWFIFLSLSLSVSVFCLFYLFFPPLFLPSLFPRPSQSPCQISLSSVGADARTPPTHTLTLPPAHLWLLMRGLVKHSAGDSDF